MPTTTQLTREPDDGQYLTLDELAVFVEAARQAGVDGASRLQARTKGGWKGPYLKTIATAPPVSAKQ